MASPHEELHQQVFDTDGQYTVTTWTTTTATGNASVQEFDHHISGTQGHEFMMVTETSSEYSHDEEHDHDSITDGQHIMITTSIFSELLGDQLLSHNANTNIKTITYIATTELEDKIVGLYFSGHWCPPSRQFTPKLVELYTNMSQEMKQNFKIVFVSSDNSEKEFNSYYNEMPWYALPYADRTRKDVLSSKYSVKGIPCLIILSPSGQIITVNGVQEVYSGNFDYVRNWFAASEITMTTVRFADEVDHHHTAVGGQQIAMTRGTSGESSRYQYSRHSAHKNDNQISSAIYFELLGDELLYHDTYGNAEIVTYISTAQLARKNIGLYFSGHWCPPSQKFTLKLIELYNSMSQEMRENFEIVFVSFDRDENEFNSYYNEMPWYALPYADRARKDALCSKYSVTAIPYLIILSSSGEVITMNGVQEVISGGISCFAAWSTVNLITREATTIVGSRGHHSAGHIAQASGEQMFITGATSGEIRGRRSTQSIAKTGSKEMMIASGSYSKSTSGQMSIAGATSAEISGHRSTQSIGKSGSKEMMIASGSYSKSSGQQSAQFSAKAGNEQTSLKSGACSKSNSQQSSQYSAGTRAVDVVVTESTSGQSRSIDQQNTRKRIAQAEGYKESSTTSDERQKIQHTSGESIEQTGEISSSTAEKRLQLDQKSAESEIKITTPPYTKEDFETQTITRNRRLEPKRSRRLYLICVGICCLLACLLALLIICVAWKYLPQIRRTAAVTVITEKDKREIALKAMFATSYILEDRNYAETIIDIDDLTEQLNMKLNDHKIRIIDGFFYNTSLSNRYRWKICRNSLYGNILLLHFVTSLTDQCASSDEICVNKFVENFKNKIDRIVYFPMIIQFVDDRFSNISMKLCALKELKKAEELFIEKPITTPVIEKPIRTTARTTRTTTRTTTTTSTTTITVSRKAARRKPKTTKKPMMFVPVTEPISPLTTTRVSVDSFCLLIPSHLILILTDDRQGMEIRDEIPINAMINDYNNRQDRTMTFYEDTVNDIRIQLNCPQQTSSTSLGYDCGLAYHIDGWIDLNNDGRFSETENRIYYQSSTNNEMSRGTSSLRISIPPVDDRNMISGLHEMQLQLRPSDYYNRRCGFSDYSQTRKYTLNIVQVIRQPVVTTTIPPLAVIKPVCSLNPAKIMSISMVGQQNTELRDQTPLHTAINDYQQRQYISVSLCESSVNMLHLQLDCGRQSRDNSYDDGCNLRYSVDVHIDFNDDGVFDEFENRVLHHSLSHNQNSRGEYNLEVCIPSIDNINTRNGQHRMRVRLTLNGDYERDCENSGYSEVREYMVNILPKAMCGVACPVLTIPTKTFTCTSNPAKITFVHIGGEQATQIRDETPSGMLVSAYQNRHHLSVTWYGYTVYIIRIQLDCPQQYNQDVLDNDCALVYHPDVWIDLNGDGKFDTFENRIHRRSRIDSETFEHGYDLQVSIPAIDGINVKVGLHLMRIRLIRSDAYQRECGKTDYSEIREYNVNIIPRKRCPDAGYVNEPEPNSEPDFIVHLVAAATESTLCLPGNLMCSAGSNAILSMKLLGEQNTLLHDEMTRCSATDNYHDQSRLSVKLFENKMYMLKIELYCVEPWSYTNSDRIDRSSVTTNCNIPHYLDVWMDLDNDGQFDETRERLLTDEHRNTGYINGIYDLNIDIPVINRYNMIDEPHIMRVMLSRDSYNRKPCHNGGHGEARDYTVYIIRQP
ncbi:hypothetical protein I4U23_004143 [Adineta vaga]|nr:hypothetical protein I4U23_004143 [Adineta vaga]